MKPKKIESLPRETRSVVVRSHYRRSLTLARKASKDARENPNPGTLSRRRDRTLAAWSMSRKYRFVCITNHSTLRGAARLGAIRRAARSYYRALAIWKGYYQSAHAM